MKIRQTPSEAYLMFQRVITFLDEWLFYALLCGLMWWGIPANLFWTIVAIGTLMTVLSYLRQWRWEDAKWNCEEHTCSVKDSDVASEEDFGDTNSNG